MNDNCTKIIIIIIIMISLNMCDNKNNKAIFSLLEKERIIVENICNRNIYNDVID